MSKTMINKSHELLYAQDVWHPCSPQDNEARTCFLKNSWSLSRGFLILEGKTFAFGYSECLSFSLVNVNRPGECFQQDRIFLLAELHRRYCHGGMQSPQFWVESWWGDKPEPKLRADCLEAGFWFTDSALVTNFWLGWLFKLQSRLHQIFSVNYREKRKPHCWTDIQFWTSLIQTFRWSENRQNSSQIHEEGKNNNNKTSELWNYAVGSIST